MYNNKKCTAIPMNEIIFYSKIYVRVIKSEPNIHIKNIKLLFSKIFLLFMYSIMKILD